MRKLRRSVAKGNMRAAKCARLTKGGIFRRCWRDWVRPSKAVIKAYQDAMEQDKKARKKTA